MVLTASPWGLGGVLIIDDVPVEYFSSPTSAADAAHLGIPLTRDSKCQQAFEALAVLVALRHWRYHWQRTRCVITCGSDNIAALSIVCKLQPKSGSLNAVAREIALDIAAGVYQPQIATHIPGIANVAPDLLSRWDQPGHKRILPAALTNATMVTLAPRDENFWKASSPPPR